jgi:hypothetical protein
VFWVGPSDLTWVNRPDGPGPLDDRFTILGATDDQPAKPDRRTYRLEIPPGRYTVRATSVAPPDLITGDTRPIHYSVTDITFTEVPTR